MPRYLFTLLVALIALRCRQQTQINTFLTAVVFASADAFMVTSKLLREVQPFLPACHVPDHLNNSKAGIEGTTD